MESAEEPLPCVGKLSFETKVQAEASAAVAEWQHGSNLKAYQCQHCGLWHLTTGEA